MIVLGLTGSIGMGKTVAARNFRALGAAVFEADAEVHRLFAPGGRAVGPVGEAFPECFCDTPRGPAVDRAALGKQVFGDARALARLEAIVHPLVRQAEGEFLRRARRRRCRLAVLDIPLLFETGGTDHCDAVAVVHAPVNVQRGRVLRRQGMTAARFADILSHQMSSQEKCRRADFIIPTGLGRRTGYRAVQRIVCELARTDFRELASSVPRLASREIGTPSRSRARSRAPRPWRRPVVMNCAIES